MSYVHSLILIVLVVNHSAMANEPPSEIPLEEALRLIERFEHNWDRISFTADAFKGKLANVHDLKSLVRDPTFVHASVVAEPLAGRARVDLRSVFDWIRAIDPYGATTACYGVGDAIHRQWEIQKGGVEPPPVGNRGVGQIGPEDEQKYQQLVGVSGMGSFPPFFRNHRLSESLRKVIQRGKPVSINRRTDGKWEIDTYDFTIDESEWDTTNLRIKIDYDPVAGGVVTGAAFDGEPPGQPGVRKLWAKLVVDLVDVDGGMKAPRLVEYVNLLEGSAVRVSYSDIQRNRTIDPASYRISFPRGIHVTDNIHNKMYVVGSGLENDQRAVQAFIERYKLVEPAPSRARLGLWLIAGIMVLTVGGAWWLWRRKRSFN